MRGQAAWLENAGALALVFTDVQGSTSLWEHCPGAMDSAIQLHHAVLRRAIAALGGYEVRTEGDAFFAVFAEAVDAVRFCLSAQRDLLGAGWPAELLAQPEACEQLAGTSPLFRGLRVRMGVHWGEPLRQRDEATGRIDFRGPATLRAERVSSAAHGGQILVSGPAWERVRTCAAALDAAHSELGEFHLDGLQASERLVQLLPRELSERRFQAARARPVRRTNLPPEGAAVVGREGDLSALEAALGRPERVVTLWGPGGIGKTRLAIEAGRRSMNRFAEGGVWLAELAEARSLDGLLTVLARVLGVTLGGSSEQGLEQLGGSLAVRGRTLLVLDNLEQVIDLAAPAVERLRAAAPLAVFLITSRIPLRLPTELIHEVGPLGLDGGCSGEAARLFVDRARLSRPGWSPGPADLEAIAAIVARLDGLPLAIELAAARLRVFSPGQLLQRLSRKFEVLASVQRGPAARQATLKGALEWSWNLLGEAEQAALAQLSVFRGGFTSEAAGAVLRLPGGASPAAALQALRDHALVREEAGRRLGQFESVRELAAEKLAAMGGAGEAEARHARHFLEAGAAWSAGVDSAEGPSRLARLEAELENLVAVHARAVARPGPAEGAREALLPILHLGPLFSARGPFSTHRKLLETALSAARAAGCEPSLLTEGLDALGNACRACGDYPAARAAFEEALAASRSTAGPGLEARVLLSRGRLEAVTAEFEAAISTLLRAQALHQAAGDRRGEGLCLFWLGFCDGGLKRWASCRDRLERAVATLAGAGAVQSEGQAVAFLALAAAVQGDRGRFEECNERALRIARDFGDRAGEARQLANSGVQWLAWGESPRAVEQLQRAHGLARELGDAFRQAFCEGYLGVAALSAGDAAEAADRLRQAADRFSTLKSQSFEDLFRAFLAAALALSGRSDEGERALAAMRASVARRADQTKSALASVCEGLVFLGAAREGRGPAGEQVARARELARQARSRGPASAEHPQGTPSPAELIEDVRIALGILDSQLAQEHEPSAA